MSEWLTDEQLDQLEDIAQDGVGGLDESNSMTLIREVRALRAERAKPTQSDEELAIKVCADMGECATNWEECLPYMTEAFASIRAEGRAELEAAIATLDDEIASHQDTLRLWNDLRAERAKLEAALREMRIEEKLDLILAIRNRSTKEIVTSYKSEQPPNPAFARALGEQS
jgi:hypothetical protein